MLYTDRATCLYTIVKQQTCDTDFGSEIGRKPSAKSILCPMTKHVKENVYSSMESTKQEELDDTKWVTIIRISKKNRRHNGQKKKYKWTNNDLQNIHIKLKIE
jgi:hypothetical protein